MLLVAALTPAPLAADAGGWMDGALDYLESTHDEFGGDVAVLLEVVAQLTGEPRAAAVATARRSTLPPDEREDLAPLFEIAKPILRRPGSAVGTGSAVAGSAAPSAEPIRTPIHRCLKAAIHCELTPACLATVEDRAAPGFEAAHPAVWLLFVRWRGCRAPIDLDAMQRDLVERLEAELKRDPTYSEVSLERVATLGQLGYGAEIDPLWEPTILGARSEQGCWGVTYGAPCHPHPTVLALWALAILRSARR